MSRGLHNTDDEITAEIRRRLKADLQHPCGKMHIAMTGSTGGFSCNWVRFKVLFSAAAGVTDPLTNGKASSKPAPVERAASDGKWYPTALQRTVLSLMHEGLSLHVMEWTENDNGSDKPGERVWIAQDQKRFPMISKLNLTRATVAPLIDHKLLDQIKTFKKPSGAAYALSAEGLVVTAKFPGDLTPYISEVEAASRAAAAKKAEAEAVKEEPKKAQGTEEAAKPAKRKRSQK
mgnify:FL=1